MLVRRIADTSILCLCLNQITHLCPATDLHSWPLVQHKLAQRIAFEIADTSIPYLCLHQITHPCPATDLRS